MKKLAITAAATLGVLGFVYASGEWVYEGQWGSPGTGPGEFSWVCGVAVAPNGDVYTLEFWEYDGRVQYFTATGSYRGRWKVADEVYALAVAPDTNVYVTAWNWVYYYTAAGSFIDSWGYYPHLYYIFGADAAANGNVYVCDAGNNKVQYFTGTGSKLGEWGREGSGNGQFNNPSGVGIGPNGNVYVADYSNYRVQYFNSTGSFIGKWGSRGSGDGQFDGPIELAVGPDGRVYVLDISNYRVQYFTAGGSFLGKFGKKGKRPGRFQDSYGLALSPDGRRLYVADTVNDRIQYFRWTETTVAPTSLGRVKALFR